MKSWFGPSKNEGQKSRILLGGIIVSFMLASYQNCGKVNQQPIAAQSIGENSIEHKPALLSLADASSLTLIGDYTHPDFGAYAYNINIKSGEVLRTMYEVPANDPSNTPVKLCLSEEKRLALERESNKASICLFKKDPLAEICTMEYISPYAIIKDQSNNTYKLGENAKPCNDFLDLCRDNRESFLKAAMDALSGLDQSYCE